MRNVGRQSRRCWAGFLYFSGFLLLIALCTLGYEAVTGETTLGLKEAVLTPVVVGISVVMIRRAHGKWNDNQDS